MAFGEGLHTADPKKKREIYMLAGVGALAVLFLIMRRSQAASSSGYTTTDLQNATAAGAAQQAQADQAATGGMSAAGTPSTFADNGESAASLANSITTALGGVQTSLDNLTNAQGAVTPNGSINATAAPTDFTTLPKQISPGDPGFAAAAGLMTAPAAGSSGFHPKTPKGAPAGAKYAGPNKPGPGWKGLGGGWWAPPTPPTIRTATVSTDKPKTVVKSSHGTPSHHTSGTKTHAQAKKRK